MWSLQGVVHPSSACEHTPVPKLARAAGCTGWIAGASLHKCHFIFSISKTSLRGRGWEAASVPLWHWKLKKRIHCSCCVWRSTVFWELRNLMESLSCHFVYSGLPWHLLPISVAPRVPFPSTCSSAKEAMRVKSCWLTKYQTADFCQSFSADSYSGLNHNEKIFFECVFSAWKEIFRVNAIRSEEVLWSSRCFI